jgi:hypothetical protein
LVEEKWCSLLRREKKGCPGFRVSFFLEGMGLQQQQQKKKKKKQKKNPSCCLCLWV